jgi:asparagine synthase (glutamine-hydrolysing)
MCGIAGFVDLGLDIAQADMLLHRMTTVLRHRGPDDDGHWLGDGVGLGMRRLSIIDVRGGQQPVTSEDGAVMVVFNGEIYNFQALRRELEATGHHFATNSDTETIVHAYEDDGVDFVQRLRGMFAIALWDRKRHRLVLASDRFGKKPLYYAYDGQRLIFGSEMKALLLVPDVRRELDPCAITQYFTLGYIPAPRTALRGIHKLPAAHVLTLERGTVRLRRYWQLDWSPRCEDDVETAARRVRDLLTEAVRMRLVSEVPIGAFLSGGVDSSAVVAFMSQVAPERVRTFSIGFDEKDFSELEYARMVAQRYDTEHHEFIVRMDLLDDLPRLVWAFDEPFADASMVPTYYVSKLAREHVTVALSGDGGDELFGGYTRYLRAAFEQRLGAALGPLRTLGPAMSRLMPDGMRGKSRLRSLALEPNARYAETFSIYPTPLREQFLRPELLAAASEDPRRVLLDHLASAPALDLSTRLQHADVECYLPYDILVKVDKASMFSSLETRAPLLDHVLAEYVAGLPVGVRLPGGQQKSLLKRAVGNDLPSAVLHRRKMGFGLPIKHWLRADLRILVGDVLHSQQARTRGIVNLGMLERMVNDHQRRLENHDSRIWSWLCFELWCQLYLDSTSVPERAPQIHHWGTSIAPAALAAE